MSAGTEDLIVAVNSAIANDALKVKKALPKKELSFLISFFTPSNLLIRHFSAKTHAKIDKGCQLRKLAVQTTEDAKSAQWRKVKTRYRLGNLSHPARQKSPTMTAPTNSISAIQAG